MDQLIAALQIANEDLKQAIAILKEEKFRLREEIALLEAKLNQSKECETPKNIVERELARIGVVVDRRVDINYLAQAFQIYRNETSMLAQKEHIIALVEELKLANNRYF